MSNLTIRPAQRADVEAIQRLYRQLDGHHAELLPEVFRPQRADARPDAMILDAIDRPDAAYLLAELDGTVTGFVQVQRTAYPDYPMFRPRAFAMIDNLVVDRFHRGQGIGGILLEAATAWAQDHGLRYVQAVVWEANADARSFYLAHGFAPLTLRLELDSGPLPASQAGQQGPTAPR